MSSAKRQKFWSLDLTTTSTLVPSGKSALAFAECGHVCTPGLLESRRARVRSLGAAPPSSLTPPVTLLALLYSLPPLLSLHTSILHALHPACPAKFFTLFFARIAAASCTPSPLTLAPLTPTGNPSRSSAYLGSMILRPLQSRHAATCHLCIR